MVDVDWYVEDDQPKYRILVDREKAALNGITDEDVAKVLRLASAGDSAGLLHAADEKEDVPIMVRLARAAAFRPRAPEELETARPRRQPRRARRDRSHRERHRRQEHLPQEPDAGDLRHRRPGGSHRKPGLRHAESRRPRSNESRSRKVTASSSTRPACRPPTHATHSNGTASGTSPTRSFATSAWRSAWC